MRIKYFSSSSRTGANSRTQSALSFLLLSTIATLLIAILNQHVAMALFLRGEFRRDNGEDSGLGAKKALRPKPCKSNITRDDEPPSHGFYCGTGRYPIRKSHRIFWGEQTPEDQYPYVVSILINDRWTRECAGVLISDEAVLTAANCIQPNQHYSIGIGSSPTNWRIKKPVYNVWVPFDYQPGTPGTEAIVSDIAFLWIEHTPREQGSDFVNHVCLLKKSDSIEPPLYALGWGENEKGKIQQNLKKRKLDEIPDVVANNLKCSKIRSSQQDKVFSLGDFGGPLLVLKNGLYYLAGIMTSQPIINETPYNCYSMFLDWMDWIERIGYMVTFDRKYPNTGHYKEIPILGGGNPYIKLEGAP